MAYDELHTAYWNYWCYYRTSRRHKITGAEVVVSTGSYVPSTFGMVRIGEKISDLDSTHELVERYVSALQPNLGRLCNGDSPESVNLTAYYLSHQLNEGESRIQTTIKPFANSSGSAWATDTAISYEDIVDYSVPFDMTQAQYDALVTTYEKTVDADLSAEKSYWEDLETMFFKFMEGQTLGFTLSATGGYFDLHGPSHLLYFLRPIFIVNQIVSFRVHTNMTLDMEITAESKVEGQCRDYEGNAISGSQTRITTFDPDSGKIIGTGLSSVDGVFSVSLAYKPHQQVVVSFANTTENLAGSELMTTLPS